MEEKIMKSMDGNSAAAHIAYAFSEVVALYPITPSSAMGELVDSWSSKGKKNIFGTPVGVYEMQSEAGAAGAVHGALAGGAFCTTFTASQGLLLMIPNLYKIAGELLPTVFHVSARALAGQGLSIFGDHQDVMAAKSSGFCLLCSNSVQEVMDLALVSHLSSLRLSLPFIHFFDGFRTSHEIQKIEEIPYSSLLPLINPEDLLRHRKRALNPEHPHLRGSAQNPDIYFQEMEALNSFYAKVPLIVQEEMDKVFKLTGRSYHLFDYVGHPEAEKVLVMMGSGAETAEETISSWIKEGEKVGLIKVRLYRPFSADHFLKILPPTVKKLVVLDRTKEINSFGEPLFLDVSSSLQSAKKNLLVVGGRYGLGSKDFTPKMVVAAFKNLDLKEPKNSFSVGIQDDVLYRSLPLDFSLPFKREKETTNCKFWGLGGDGTVGANKDAIKIIGDFSKDFVQGYFAYDSKKTSGLTVSHLRFGKNPIHSTYLIDEADYIACHHPSYVKKYDVLDGIRDGGVFVLNSPWDLSSLEKHLPPALKRKIAQNHVQFYNIHAAKIAEEVGLGRRINMIMQTVFFKLIGVFPIDTAIKLLKEAIAKEYGKKGEHVVAMNQKAVDLTLQKLEKIEYPSSWKDCVDFPEKEENLPSFIQDVAKVMNAQKGDLLPVSAFTPGGFFPLGTTQYEKRDIALQLPKWIPENCIQCNQCAFVCPHAAIRPFLSTPEARQKAPSEFAYLPHSAKEDKDLSFTIAVSPFDCTGCQNCADVCPGKNGKKALEMKTSSEVKDFQEKIWNFAMTLPDNASKMNPYSVKGSQFKKPLLEFSGACAGCGETPYVKLLTQLFGERMIIANATGCSSIWGGSAPSIPWTVTPSGYGPAWGNSLFEDNAEYGLGIESGVSYLRNELKSWIKEALQKEKLSSPLKAAFEEWITHSEEGELSQKLSQEIKPLLESAEKTPLLKKISERKDLLTKASIWTIGGDGWAYDIGYGGLDHVLAMNHRSKILVLDTEVYSNTGGQASKATPLSAIAKFAAGGKKTMKKDLGLIALTYGHIYVASVSLGADKQQLVKAFKEAESYSGPALILAYASCIEHGDPSSLGIKEEKAAVDAGYWFNYRFDPRLKAEGKNPFQLDSKAPTLPLDKFLATQVRFNYLLRTHPEEAKILHQELEQHLKHKYALFKKWSEECPF